MPKSVPWFVCLIALMVPFPAQHRGGGVQNTCDCSPQLRALIEKVEANYIGYVMGSRANGYEAIRTEVMARAETAGPADCLEILRQYVYWFEDGHLFVNDLPSSTLDTNLRRPVRLSVPLNERQIRDDLVARSNDLDPIEGIWYAADGQRFGIVRDRRGISDFVAVMLTDGIDGWRIGDVNASFERRADDTYSTTFYAEDHVPVHPSVYRRFGTGATIQRNALLHMPPYTWGRELPAGAVGHRLEPQHPRAPLLFSYPPDTNVVVISLPSFSVGHREALDGLVEANANLLAAAKIVIVDIRGNEGGSSVMPRALEPYFGVREGAAEPFEPLALSSPDNIAYFRRLIPQGWIPQGLIGRLEAAPGQIVPFQDPRTGENTSVTPSVVSAPGVASHLVAILMDRYVVSAGPAFAVRARAFGNVTLFGENTGGMIDYQNVTLVRFGCPEIGLFVGYPTLASTAELPDGALNPVGIAPDIRTNPHVEDPYAEIIEYYRSGQIR